MVSWSNHPVEEKELKKKWANVRITQLHKDKHDTLAEIIPEELRRVGVGKDTLRFGGFTVSPPELEESDLVKVTLEEGLRDELRFGGRTVSAVACREYSKRDFLEEGCCNEELRFGCKYELCFGCLRRSLVELAESDLKEEVEEAFVESEFREELDEGLKDESDRGRRGATGEGPNDEVRFGGLAVPEIVPVASILLEDEERVVDLVVTEELEDGWSEALRFRGFTASEKEPDLLAKGLMEEDLLGGLTAPPASLCRFRFEFGAEVCTHFLWRVFWYKTAISMVKRVDNSWRDRRKVNLTFSKNLHTEKWQTIKLWKRVDVAYKCLPHSTSTWSLHPK
jgi:hypothetical protein